MLIAILRHLVCARTCAKDCHRHLDSTRQSRAAHRRTRIPRVRILRHVLELCEKVAGCMSKRILDDGDEDMGADATGTKVGDVKSIDRRLASAV